MNDDTDVVYEYDLSIKLHCLHSPYLLCKLLIKKILFDVEPNLYGVGPFWPPASDLAFSIKVSQTCYHNQARGAFYSTYWL